MAPRSRAHTRQPSLATVARRAATEAKQKRIAANPVRRWLRRFTAAAAIAFAMVGLFGSAAQADWPWVDGQNTISTIMNVCRGNDVPSPVKNVGPNSQTVVPQFTKPGDGGDGLNRLGDALRNAKVGDGSTSNAYNIVANVKDQGFNRYGYGTLQWDQYGSTCFTGPGQLLTGPANAMFLIAVTGPAILLTAFLNFALNNVFYDLFFGWVNPFMELFATVLSPWVLMIVLIGGSITILIRSKGSLARILQLGAWMLAMLAIFFGIQTQGLGKQITALANNAVTQATNLIACQVVTGNATTQNVINSGGGACGTIDSFDINRTQTAGIGDGKFKITGGIDQAIWYAIPYQVWSMGAVGSTQYGIDHENDQKNNLSWSAALLNAKHVGNDSLGQSVQTYSGRWNQAGYMGSGAGLEGQKIRIWTAPADKGWDADNGNGDQTRAWNAVPYLGLVKALCNDTATGTAKSEDPKNNRWLYQGECDPAGAGVNFLPAFKGDVFWERGSAVVSGAVGILAVAVPLAAVSLYLMSQKMIFFFILLFAPVFLAIGAFPDEKRMGFAKKYAEMFIANLIKQVVAVCVLLFVMTGVSGVLTSNAAAWWFKPIGIVMFTFGMIMFAIPVSTILKAAAKGDTSIVEKTLNLPQRVAGGAAKVAGVAAVATATMGIGAAAAGATASGAGAAAAGAGAGAAGTGAGGLAGAAATAAGRRGVGGLVKNGVGVMKSGAGVALGGLKTTGAKGAADNFTRMIRSGEAMRLIRYTGLGDKPLGKILRSGLGVSQVGLGFINRNQLDPTISRGIAAAREEGMARLNAADLAKGTAGYERLADGSLTDLGRQQVAADYEKFYAGDPEGDKAASATKAALDQFHKNYFKMTGEHLPTDPQSPGNNGVPPRQQDVADTIVNDIPSSKWQSSVVPNVVKEGGTILTAVGGPEALLNGPDASETLAKIYDSYGGMVNIDPTHAAAASMVNLGFASESTDEGFQQAALADALAQIEQHGLPDKINGINASRDWAEGRSPAEVLALAPNLDSSSTLEDRATAAGRFTVAAMAVPEGSTLAPSVDALREALLDPGAEISHINELKSSLAAAVMAADVRNPFFSAQDAQEAATAPIDVPAPSAPVFSAAQEVPAPIVGETVERPVPVFSGAPEAAASPAPVPAVVAPVFSSGEQAREFVQPQYREEAPLEAREVFLAHTPQASANQGGRGPQDAVTGKMLNDRLEQQRKDIVEDVTGAFESTQEQAKRDWKDAPAATDYTLPETRRARRSSGLFSNKDDDK